MLGKTREYPYHPLPGFIFSFRAVDMKVVTVIGARPQFVKAAVVSGALRRNEGVEEYLVHTGQHRRKYVTGIF